MNIIIDNIIFKWQKSGGISVVWYELIKRMLKTSLSSSYKFVEYQGADWNLFHRSLSIPSSDILYTKSSKVFGLKRYFGEPIRQMKEKFIFHSTYYRTCSNPNAINIVTVHDFTYELYSKGIRKWIHSWTKNHALRKADYIICISENTKKDLLKFVRGIDKEKIHVIYNGASDDFYKFEDNSLRYNTNQEDYLVFIGSRAAYKNYALAVQVAAAANMRLKIVGNMLSDIEKSMTQNIIGNNYDELGYIDNSALNKLYNKAFALLYPSAYEGFGLPVIEAQKAGCPVLALNTSSIKEIIGERELLINGTSPEQFVQKIERLKNSEYRNSIIEKGLINANKYSWDKTVKQYVLLYEDIIKKQAIRIEGKVRYRKSKKTK